TCAAAALGALVALPALRLGGRSLALATLALAFLADQVLFQMGWLRNGDTGWEIPRPVFGPVDLSDDRAMGVAMVVLVTATVASLACLRNSPSGRAMLAVRSAPAAAMASGISVVRTKLLLFTLSAGLAGFGGVMYASFNTRITATDFTAMTGLIWLAVVVAAGVRRPQFAVVAGLVFAIVPHLVADYVTESVHLPVILFGLAGLALANDPDGYCAAVSVRRHRRRGRVGVVPESPSSSGVSIAPQSPPLPSDRPPTETPPPALALHGIHAGHDGAPVLHGVDLAVHAGEIVALLGPNGAGKSTVCRTAAGLIAPSQGHVYVAGRDATREGAALRSRGGVVLAPEGRGIFPSLTIDENLALYLRERDERDAVYERFAGLAARRRVPAGSLSGGEQQLLALAPLLQRPPKVLIADEPSLGLAPRIVDDVFRLLVELRDAGAGLLLVEEKAAEILGVADTVAYLAQGRVSWCGPRAEVRADRLTEAYLGMAANGGRQATKGVTRP
ncbi:ATP-binding cassette domain-containing protein, partial [Streptomyces sp. SID10116]|nr:ATP-binding cassette domain-containing protein [Streptomyces sp. SID10116]